MTTHRKTTFVPAVYALPKLGNSSSLSIPAASPYNIPLYAIPLPQSFVTWKSAEQNAYLENRIREHYIRNQGVIPLLGHIVIYLLHRHPEESPIPFTVHGNPIPPSGTTPLPTVTFTPHEWSIARRAFIYSICSKDENTFH
jgi:hypothetical protein